MKEKLGLETKIKGEFPGLVFDFLLLSLSSSLLFVLSISEVTKKTSPFVLISAELVNRKPLLAELTGNLGPGTEGTGWGYSQGNCSEIHWVAFVVWVMYGCMEPHPHSLGGTLSDSWVSFSCPRSEHL